MVKDHAETDLDRELDDLPTELRWREWMRRIEAVLFASASPVPREDLARVVGQGASVELLIEDLAADLDGRSFEVTEVASGWMLRTRPAMRLSGVQDNSKALVRIGWAVRRLTGGPGPKVDLAAFLDRRDPENIEVDAERFEDRAGGWLDVMAAAANLHPLTRACMGFHLWSLAGLGQHGDQIEAAVTAARIAASDGSGAIFAPLAMGGAGGLRAGGLPAERLACWLQGIETACFTAMRHLDDIEAWTARAEAEMTSLSGKTPPALRAVLTEWQLVSAPMVEALIGASRAAVQRNLA